METVAAFTNLEASEESQVCSVLDVSGHSMQVKLRRPVAPGSAVKVEADDTMSLGEVRYCKPEGDGYVVWVDLMEALHHVAELTRLARGVLSY